MRARQLCVYLTANSPALVPHTLHGLRGFHGLSGKVNFSCPALSCFCHVGRGGVLRTVVAATTCMSTSARQAVGRCQMDNDICTENVPSYAHFDLSNNVSGSSRGSSGTLMGTSKGQLMVNNRWHRPVIGITHSAVVL